MLLNYLNQKVVPLSLSDEAESGSGGDQPERNSLTNWNGKRGAKVPQSFSHSNCICLRKRIFSQEKRE